jgi:glucosylceramidase
MKKPSLILLLSITTLHTSAQTEMLQVITTAANTDFRLTETGSFPFTNSRQALESEVSIFVQTETSFQTFIGIGGAVTDASAEVFAQLSPLKQQELLTAYFDKENGIGYNLVRVPIHSSDFSSESFTYVAEGDTALETFNIEHDKTYRLPLLTRIWEETSDSILLYASPWSPPAFMKSNGSMLQGGKLLPSFADAWASYYVRFIDAYEQEGFPIWGITIQNEPMAVQRWESCIYTAEEEMVFLRDHLGPAMHKAGYADKKIIVWDHNRDLIFQRAATIFNDKEASKYAWGIGFHWYETWAGGEPMFENLGKVKEAFPNKELVFTEGCQELFATERLQYWPNAERYGRSIINDFNQGTVAWTDWNILLNEKGGPNHVSNFCFAPVHADLAADTLIFTPSYYYLGHFSKYIRPGAQRKASASSRSHLISTTFQNPDDSFVTVVMNQGDQEITYFLQTGKQSAEVTIPPHAIQTLLYRL